MTSHLPANQNIYKERNRSNSNNKEENMRGKTKSKIFLLLAVSLFAFSFVSASLCYQEDAITANQAGNDGNCGLIYSGTYSIVGAWNNGIGNLHDGSWATLSIAGFPSYYYVNYSKPINAVNATWMAKDYHASGSAIFNMTVPASCFNAYANVLSFQLESHQDTNDYWRCLNATGWQLLTNVGFGGTQVYEEGIWWNISMPSNAILISPVNNSYSNNSNINFTANVSSDYGLSNATVFIYNQSNSVLINKTTISLSGLTAITGKVITLIDGIYTWFYQVFDTSNNNYITENRTLTVDTKFPLIDWGTGIANNGINVSQNFIYFNTTWTETNFNLSLSVYYSGGSSTYYNYPLHSYIFVAPAGDRVYTYNATICDFARNCNTTSTRTITLDTTKPSLSIVYPQATNYSINISSLNYTVSDANLFNCWYSINGAANQSVTCGTNLTAKTSVEGYNNWTVYANDTASNLQNATVTFFKDTIFPQIDWGNLVLSDGQNKSQSNIYMNVTITEINFQNITFNVNNVRQTYTIRTYDFNKTGLANGTFYYNVTVCDTVNNCNITSTRQITLDTGTPNATLVSPINNLYTNNATQNFTVNLSDNLGIKNATLSIYNQTGLYNQTTINFIPSTITTVIGITVNMIENAYTWFYQLFDWAGNSYTTQNQNNTLYVDINNVSYCHPIQSPGVYYLDTNINATGTCFNIQSSDVTLDCQNYLINGPASGTNYGITSNGYNNLTIKNCQIKNFYSQIYLLNSNGDTLLSNRLSNSILADTSGIKLSNTNNLFITNNTIQNNSGTIFYGINIATANNISFSNNTIRSNLQSTGYGIYSTSLTNSTSLRDTIINSNLQDIYLSGASGNLIKHTVLNKSNVLGFSNSNTFLNTTDSPTISGTGTNQYIRQWYLDINVTDVSNNVVDLAQVNIFNLSSNLVYSGLTFMGAINNLILNQYSYSGAVQSNSTTHTINVSKALYDTNSSSITMNTNKYYNIKLPLSDAVNPNIQIVYPQNLNYSSVTSINYTVSDTNLQACWYALNGGINLTITCGQNITGLSPPAGANIFTVYANDTYNNINSSSVTFFLDQTNPNATQVSPSSGSSTNNGTTNFTYNISDNLGVVNSTLHVWNQTAEVNSTTTIGGSSPVQVIINLIEGVYNWFISLFDVVGNQYTSGNYTLTVDVIAPSLNINYPVANANYTSVTSFNYSSNGVRCWNSINGGVTNSSSVACNTNFSLTASEGLNTWTVYANDSVNNINSSSVTFRKDSTAPTLNIILPQATSYGSTTIALNYSVSDNGVGLSTCWYRNDTDANNITIACGTNTTISNAEGSHTLYFWSNDTLNNVASASVTYSISLTAPAIALNNPTNNLFTNKTSILFNVTSTDSDGTSICELWGNWSGAWAKNQTVAVTSGVQTNFNQVTLSQGNYIWNARCNDSLGNGQFFFTNYTLTVDTTNPSSALITPATGSSSGTSNNFTANLTDNLGIKNATLNIYNSTALVNQTTVVYSGTLTSTIGIVVSLIDGLYNWFYSLFDLAGNHYQTGNNTLTIDTVFPNLSINSPLNIYYTFHNISINISAIDTNIQSTWFNYNGTNYSYQSNNSFLVSGIMSPNATGTYLINGTCNGYNQFRLNATWYLWYDTSAGIPANWQYTISTGCNVIGGPSWLQQNTGTGNPLGDNYLYFPGQSTGAPSVSYANSIINFPDGQYNLTAYANDSRNQISSSSVSFTVDTVTPNITINSPANTTYSSQNIALTFTPSETLNNYWYNLGAANTSFTNGQTISFNPGDNLLIVYGNDTAGNVGSSSVRFHVTYTNLITMNITTSSTPQIGTNLTFNVNVTTDNTRIVWCNFSLTSPTHQLYTNQVGTNVSNIWTAPYYLINESGTYNQNVTCMNEFGNKAYSNSSFVVDPYVLTIISPNQNYSFAARVIKTEQNNISLGAYDNVNGTINYSLFVAIDNSSNFTLTYPNSITFDSTDSASSPKSAIVQIQATADVNEGRYTGNITLTNQLTGEKTYLFFTYGIMPPSGIPRIYKQLSGFSFQECTSSFSDAQCKINIDLDQGSNTAYDYYLFDTGSYTGGLTDCQIRFTDNLAGNTWITASPVSQDLLKPSAFQLMRLSVSPSTSVTAQTYYGHMYLHCSSGDAFGDAIDSNPANAPYIQVQVTSVDTSSGTGSSGGGTPTNNSNINASQITGLCGNGNCERDSPWLETYDSCAEDCSGDLSPLTDCLGGVNNGQCLLAKGTALLWIVGFMGLVFLFLLFAEKKKSQKQAYTPKIKFRR